MSEPQNDDSWPYDVTEVASEGQNTPQDALSAPEADDTPEDGFSVGEGAPIAPESVLGPLLSALWDDSREVIDFNRVVADSQAAFEGFLRGYLYGTEVADETLIIANDPACRRYDVTLTNEHFHAHGVAVTNGSGAIVASMGEQFPQRVWERAGWTISRA